MRFKAPEHVTGVSLAAGEFTVDKNGYIDVPDDLSVGDIGGLSVNGFVSDPAPETGKKAKAEPATDAAA